MKKILTGFAAIAFFCFAGITNAATITGTFNANSYQTIDLNVATAATVDFQYLSGYYDPIFMLFNGAGDHLISNDDTALGVFSHLTQNLSIGNYTLLVSYCCQGINALNNPTFLSTDGFNSGSYYVGTGTLSGIKANLDNHGFTDLPGSAFSLSVTNAAQGFAPVGNVPEPHTVALLGLGLLGFVASRRKSAK